MNEKGDLISRQAVKDIILGGVSTDTDADKEYVCGLIDNLPSVENKGEWIPVTERLPEDSEWQLVSVMDCEGFSFALPRIARIETDGKWHYANAYENQYDYFYKVVAWQPIPEPYRKGE